LPCYVLHKPTGQARVRIAGQDYSLGEFGSGASRIAYGQLVAKLAGGIPIDPIAKSKRGSQLRMSEPDRHDKSAIRELLFGAEQ
jgi:hypothetical protein